MKSSVIASLVAAAASQDVFLGSNSLGQEFTSGVAGPGMELSLSTESDSSCLAKLNGFRHTKGLKAMTIKASSNSCAGTQAKKDAASSPHAHFGDCGEHGQCEALGTHSCEDSLQMYFNEGPGSGSAHGHYNIIMGSYSQMSYGHCESCGSYGTFWTMNFY